MLHLAQVIEEIVVFDHVTNEILNYVMIQERSNYTLSNLANEVWPDAQQVRLYGDAHHTFKTLYFFLQAIDLLVDFHKNGIYFGNLRSETLQVYANNSIKITDLMTTMKFDLNDLTNTGNYVIKGYHVDYVTPEIKENCET